ncbi:serine/arginine-rich splicing factor RS2Z32 isoform X2 [Brachypodium distachyon]|uniref:Uncharacterized protein n=1 Tax=Brachypodium distachyon TaxID=15368 RepID=A0A0Q3K8X8_BRADI|nr:serine/arginine-rich splicing factor RS2Z32 isoform X2 [Brachypodium distachyon]KQK07345.1 hypothetical protein BRADI_2g34687v3 [Brachypodium distachyon]|eukprot:XP_014754274.1 serine/arginine-rich splicing factor RS2Z32 isoform X2 [Brachypodium distachyon]
MHFCYHLDGFAVSVYRFRRVRNVELKHDYGFVEFSDPRDADDARYELDGRDFDGSRIIVEFAKGTPRGPGGSFNYVGRSLPPGSGRCFNCGIEGHWARDCKAGNWKNKCYRCGEMGHIEKNCQNSPKNLKRGGRYSRSPSPQRGRSRSRSYSRGHKGYSQSPSPRRDVLEEMPSPRRDDRGAGLKERRPISSSYSPRRSASPSGCNRSPTSNGMSHPPRKQAEGNGSHHSARGDSQSPAHDRRPATNGRGLAPEHDGKSGVPPGT